MLKVALFLLLPAFSLAQVSIGPGTLLTGSRSPEIGFSWQISAQHQNEAMSAGVRYLGADVKGVQYAYFQAFLGPRFRWFHAGLTVDLVSARYQDFKITTQGAGVRLAGYFPLGSQFGVMAEVNPGWNPGLGRYLGAGVGVWWGVK